MLLSKCGTVCCSHCIISYGTTNPSQFLSQYIIESILTGLTKVLFVNMTYYDRNSLSRVIARRLTGFDLPNVREIFDSRMKSRFQKIIAHPGHRAFHFVKLLPSGKRCRSLG